MSMAVDAHARLHRDETGAKVGMWLFLFTELILFGGLFLLYAVFRAQYPVDFSYAAGELNLLLGSVNTFILLTSSLTMALSIAALQRRRRSLAILFLSLTIGLGVLFLIDKYVEWSAKIHHGLYPGSPDLALRAPGENVFYGLYYSMTGLHGIHVLAGIVLLSFMLVMVIRKTRETVRLPGVKPEELVRLREGQAQPVLALEPGEDSHEIHVTVVYSANEFLEEGQRIKLENSGLYWHLVDVIWIFLFPLFYLIS